MIAGYALFERKIKTRYGLGVIVITSGIIFVGNVDDSVETISIILLPFLFAALVITADLSMKESVIYGCELIFLVLCIDYVIEVFVKLAEPFNISDEIAWLISNLISVFAYSCICVVRRSEKLKNSPILRVLGKVVLYMGIVMMAIVMPLTISGLSFFAESSESLESMKGIQLLSAMSMISTIMLIMFVLYINDTNKKMKQYLEIEKTLKETQKNYYEAMIQKEEDTKRFRHDVLNHIMCLRELAEGERLGEVKQYIDEMQGEMIKIQRRCYSVGNTVLDAVLNYYLQMIQESVKIKVEGYIEDKLSVTDAELCTIFSNIMRNSVEELKKQQNREKYLKVKVHAGREDIAIELCNSVQGKKEKGKGGLPETTKVDKSNHGIGLKNIKETVEKNNGMFRWESTVEEFKVEVILPLRSWG